MAEIISHMGVFVNQQPIVTGQQQVSRNGDKLRGSGPRYNMGFLVIICGVIEIILAILLLCLPHANYLTDIVGWGIWNGVFAIITGSFGMCSRRKKGMVIAFMVLAVIASLMSGACCIFQSIQASWFGYDYYGLGRLATYIIICTTYALQVLFCVIGASYTCIALCNRNENQTQQLIVYQPYVLPPGQSNLMIPHTGVVNMVAQPVPVSMTTTNGAPPPYQFVTT